MATFSCTKEEREFILNIAKNKRDELKAAADNALKAGDATTEYALSYQSSVAASKVTSVVSDSVRPHRRQPTRLPRPWDSPGRNTGVGCHFLL